MKVTQTDLDILSVYNDETKRFAEDYLEPFKNRVEAEEEEILFTARMFSMCVCLLHTVDVALSLMKKNESQAVMLEVDRLWKNRCRQKKAEAADADAGVDVDDSHVEVPGPGEWQ